MSRRLPVVQAEPWMAEGACRTPAAKGIDFFPGRGEDVNRAKAVCAACDHEATCLQYALDHGEHHGIWGGTSERDRREIRKHHRAMAS